MGVSGTIPSKLFHLENHSSTSCSTVEAEGRSLMKKLTSSCATLPCVSELCKATEGMIFKAITAFL